MPFRSKPLEEIRVQQRELLRRFDPLVGSQEKVQEELGLVEARLAESNEILGNLGSLFVEELAPVVAWLEVIGDRLLEVQRALLQPRQTAAQELRDHAFRELRKAKVQTTESDREELINRAYRHLTESATKLEGDFTVEFTLGVMELYERGEPDRAAKYLRLAAIDAKETSPYDCALSYLFLSFAHLSAGRPVEAETASREATRAVPNDAMVHYIHAEQCAGIGRTRDVLVSLERAFDLGEEHYWRGQAPAPVLFWRAVDDGAFAAMRSDVEALCRRLLDEARAEGRRLKAMVKRLAEEIADLVPGDAGSDSLKGSLGRWRMREKRSWDEAGYLDVLDANIALRQLGEKLATEAYDATYQCRCNLYGQAARVRGKFSVAGWVAVIAGFVVCAAALLGEAVLEARGLKTSPEYLLLVPISALGPWAFVLAAPFVNERYKKLRAGGLTTAAEYWDRVASHFAAWRERVKERAEIVTLESGEGPPIVGPIWVYRLTIAAALSLTAFTVITVATGLARPTARVERQVPAQVPAVGAVSRGRAHEVQEAPLKPPLVSVSGEWRGTYIDARGRKIGFSLSIEQRGSSIGGRFGERAIVNDVPRDLTGTISGTIEGRKLRFTKTYNEVEGVSVNHVGDFERGADHVNGVWVSKTTTGRWSMDRSGSQ